MHSVTYRSSVSLAILIPLAVVTTTVLVINLLCHIWAMAVLIFLLQLFIVHLYFTTTYTITAARTLRIRCGFFYKKEISIHRIKTITKTNNPLSAPAFSLKRIAVAYGHTDIVLLSPKQLDDFIEKMLKANPMIRVTD